MRRVASSRFERTTSARLKVNAAAEAIRYADRLRALSPDGVPEFTLASDIDNDQTDDPDFWEDSDD